MQTNMALIFVDLEKVSDTVPEDMAMIMVRRVGVPEAEASVTESMHERTNQRLVVGRG